MRQIVFVAAFFVALCLCAHVAFAQQPADVLKVDYFAYANTTGAADATVRITNPGTAGEGICASIFVFDPQQELSECCSCPVTPDGLRTLSVNTDLTSNPLTGVTLTTGVIKIVSTTLVSGVCPVPTKMHPVPALRAWTTHIQNSTGTTGSSPQTSYSATETAAQDATLSTAELSRLDAECNAIMLTGSGGGVCTCGTGD